MDSRQKQQHPPTVGDPAPEFSLLNTDGDPYTLSADGLEQPLVVVFYRGDW